MDSNETTNDAPASAEAAPEVSPLAAAYRTLEDKLNTLGSYVLASTEAERAAVRALIS